MSSSKSSKSLKPFHKNSGDWHCPDKSCNNLNFARRDSCNRCKKPREDPLKKKGSTGIGSALAKSSKGLFSADDWACTKCGNINWARRNQCNICNAKKFLEEDERTGLGGGFNEREKVEYKQRSSSDSDEYDEFGRKKKRKKTFSENDLKRKSRRDRSSSRSSTSSSSSSSSTQTSSSSSRSNSPKRKKSRKSRSRSRSRDERNRKSSESYEQPRHDEKSPSKSRSENESEEEESDGNEDLSKYNLFDDDIDIEALKANK